MRLIWILPCLINFPLLAQEQAATFDDSLLLGNMIIASSQSYQIKKLTCEMAGIFSRGNLESKNVDLTLEAKSQGASFNCAHSLEQNTLVIGIQGDMQQYTMDGVIVRYENLTSNYQPYLAFQLTPSLSLGISQDIESGEYKTQSGNYSTSSQRMILSGSWHQNQWELTLVYADRYRDSVVPTADIPRSLAMAARYQISPLFTAGLILTRSDYPGIATGSESPEIAIDTSVVISSRVTEVLTTELSYVKSENSSGEKDSQSQVLGISGRFALNDQIKIAGFLTQYNGDSSVFDTTMSAYGFSVSMSR